jgi:TRAP-type C4-dicarboxylate transport system substrate-binding protein
MKKILFLSLAVLLMSLCLHSSFVHAQVSLKLANFFPPEQRISVAMDQWCQEVEKRTEGRVKVTQFAGGTLTPPTQTFISVTRGVADIGLSFCSYTMGRFPLFEVIDLPLGYRSAYWATKLANEFYRKFKPKEFDDVKALFFTTSSPHMLFAKKPIRNLKDMKGLKIRSTGTSAKVVQALGGAPVAMPMSDAYDALSKGVSQGIICPYEAMRGFRLAEVVDHSAEYGSAYVNANYIVMNKDKWNAIAPNDQKAIEEINDEWIEKMGKLWDELDKDGKDYFVQMGGKTFQISKEENERWAAKLRPLLDEYVTTMKAKGLPADEALKFCEDYLMSHQK